MHSIRIYHLSGIEYTHTDAACQRAIRLQNDGCELILARGLQAALV